MNSFSNQFNAFEMILFIVAILVMFFLYKAFKNYLNNLSGSANEGYQGQTQQSQTRQDPKYLNQNTQQNSYYGVRPSYKNNTKVSKKLILLLVLLGFIIYLQSPYSENFKKIVYDTFNKTNIHQSLDIEYNNKQNQTDHYKKEDEYQKHLIDSLGTKEEKI